MEINISIFLVAAMLFACVLLKQQHMFGQIVRQNNKFVEDADKRLAKANEMDLEAKKMISKLTESNDKLVTTIIEVKDLMLRLRQEYSGENERLVENKEEYKKAYHSLLSKYNEKDKKIEEVQSQLLHTVQELARRPTINNSNNYEEGLEGKF